MLFHQTPLSGLWVVEPELLPDSRGFFTRVVCREEFATRGLNANFVQQSISFNARKGILRGLHYQKPPYEEDKLVRVTRGKILDVAVDLRTDSPTFCQWFSVELSAENRLSLYIPKGFAHGFQTLADETEILYQITTEFKPGYGCGVRWNDPAFGIAWRSDVTVELNERDASYPDFAGSLP